MKKMMLIPALVLMMSASVLAKNAPASVKVISRSMDVVYFKVSKEMIGASIEIKDENGNVIHTAKVTDKKVIVDFYAEPSGTYTIHVVKNDKDEVIDYTKNTPSHTQIASHDYVVVSQN